MHVLLVADTEEALKQADEVIGKIVNDPEHARNLKRQQLRSVRTTTAAAEALLTRALTRLRGGAAGGGDRRVWEGGGAGV